MSAVDLARAIRERAVSSREVVAAHLDRIDRDNAAVNAIVTPVPEHALSQAAAADEAIARGLAVGPLHGLPIAHKDLLLTRGIRTTFGSPIHRDFIPEYDALVVERLARAGAVTIGKTNTPEFGAGSQTYNPVFGATRNPFDTSKTCGGSSGGAAVALACGMMPIADGTDMGGSLRNPASFCGVVGLRPSSGRVPVWPAANAWSTLSVDGPMARTVEDVALLLSVMAGADVRSPLSLGEDPAIFADPLGRDLRGVRVAWAAGFAGLPYDPRIVAAVNAQRTVFEALGCIVEDDEPEVENADDVFKTLRAHAFVTNLRDVVGPRRDLVKPEILWELDRGDRLTAADLARAERGRTELYHRFCRFMERYECLVLPVTQVLPFPVEQPYPTRIGDVEMTTYIDWMKSCYFVSLTAAPAIAVPCGFTGDGLPVGLQIVGRPRGDWALLQIAHAFERALDLPRRWPPVSAAPDGRGASKTP
jgi:amidase